MNLVRTKLHIPTSLITPFNYREYIFVLQGLCDFEILGLFLWDFEWFLFGYFTVKYTIFYDLMKTLGDWEQPLRHTGAKRLVKIVPVSLKSERINQGPYQNGQNIHFYLPYRTQKRFVKTLLMISI